MYVLLQKIVKPLNFWNSLFAIGALYKNIRTFFYFHTVIQDAFFATKDLVFFKSKFKKSNFCFDVNLPDP